MDANDGAADPPLQDRRLSDLVRYWSGKRCGRAAPTRADIRLDEIARAIIPRIFVLDVVSASTRRRFRVRLAGTVIVQEYGEDPTGKFIDEVDLGPATETALAELNRAVDTAAPVSGRQSYTKNDGRRLVHEHVILPLSDDGVTVNQLFCAAAIEGVAPL